MIRAPINTDHICKLAIEHFGIENQMIKCLEELYELQVELNVDFKNAMPEKIQDELADAFIMITQMALIFGNSEVEERVKFKLDRLSSRISPIKSDAVKE